MVFTLTDLCLISLRDGVENGTFPHVYLLPPRLRQSILNAILMHGTINKSKSLDILGSVEFLSDLSSLDTQFGIVQDGKYLDRVARSMLHVSVTNLSLNLYGRAFSFYADGTGKDIKAVNFYSAIRLISQCPNLDQLTLRLYFRLTEPKFLTAESRNDSDIVDPMNIFDRKLSGGGLLNRVEAWQPCLSIIENLEELSLIGAGHAAPFLTADCPIIKFKRLASLRLSSAEVDSVAWRQLLQHVNESLTRLHLDGVSDLKSINEDDWILPFPMLNLKSLTVTGYGVPCSSFFVKTLKACKKLEYVFLNLAQRINDFESLAALNQINAALELSIVCKDDDPKIVIDYVKLVGLFEKKMKVFRLDVRTWNVQLSLLLQQVSQCHNLAELHIRQPKYYFMVYDRVNRFNRLYQQAMQECWTAKLTLKSLLSDEERASKLRQLSLVGEYDDGVLKSVFENCSNLDSLFVNECPQLRDEHFINWVDRGGKLSNLSLHFCDNVTDQGLVPILISSGRRLKSFLVFGLRQITDCTWRVLIDNAPHVERVDGVPDKYMPLLRSKCFNGRL